MELTKSFFGTVDDWLDFTGETVSSRGQRSLDNLDFATNENDGTSWARNESETPISTFAYLMGSDNNIH